MVQKFSLSLIITLVALNTISAHDIRVPVIAVMSQPATSFHQVQKDSADRYSEIVGSYVEWIEQTGSITVQIPYDLPMSEMTALLKKTQGQMLPGGAAKLMHYKSHHSTQYQNKIDAILDWAKEWNLLGNYYPIWGTCLGMEESLISLDRNNPTTMSLGVDDINTEHPLDLTPEYWQSSFFKGLPLSKKFQIKKYKEPIFYYFHHDGLTVEHFHKEKLDKEFNLLASSKAANGKVFVALMEGKNIPIYLTQFHPEKNQFEKIEYLNGLDRSPSTLKLLSSYIWRFTGLIRKKSKVFTPKEIPEVLHKYFSYKKSARNSPVKSFERIYLLHNQKTTESFRNKHKNVMNVWVKLRTKLDHEKMSLDKN